MKNDGSDSKLKADADPSSEKLADVASDTAIDDEQESAENTELVKEQAKPSVSESSTNDLADKEPEKDNSAEKVSKAKAVKKPQKEAAKEEAAEAESEEESEEEEDDEDLELGGESISDLEHDDPLAPAYDLERGARFEKHEPLMPTKFPWRTEVTSAKEFFTTEILYRHDILELEERTKLSGTYRIELKGYQGGVWTLCLGDDLNIVNRKEDAELVLTMQQKDFLQLVNGTLNPQLAILSQKMKITGDVKRAIQLQQLLAPTSE